MKLEAETTCLDIYEFGLRVIQETLLEAAARNEGTPTITAPKVTTRAILARTIADQLADDHTPIFLCEKEREKWEKSNLPQKQHEASQESREGDIADQTGQDADAAILPEYPRLDVDIAMNMPHPSKSDCFQSMPSSHYDNELNPTTLRDKAKPSELPPSSFSGTDFFKAKSSEIQHLNNNQHSSCSLPFNLNLDPEPQSQLPADGFFLSPPYPAYQNRMESYIPDDSLNCRSSATIGVSSDYSYIPSYFDSWFPYASDLCPYCKVEYRINTQSCMYCDFHPRKPSWDYIECVDNPPQIPQQSLPINGFNHKRRGGFSIHDRDSVSIDPGEKYSTRSDDTVTNELFPQIVKLDTGSSLVTTSSSSTEVPPDHSTWNWTGSSSMTQQESTLEWIEKQNMKIYTNAAAAAGSRNRDEEHPDEDISELRKASHLSRCAPFARAAGQPQIYRPTQQLATAMKDLSVEEKEISLNPEPEISSKAQTASCSGLSTDVRPPHQRNPAVEEEQSCGTTRKDILTLDKTKALDRSPILQETRDQMVIDTGGYSFNAQRSFVREDFNEPESSSAASTVTMSKLPTQHETSEGKKRPVMEEKAYQTLKQLPEDKMGAMLKQAEDSIRALIERSRKALSSTQWLEDEDVESIPTALEDRDRSEAEGLEFHLALNSLVQDDSEEE